nr:hypothetical protein GCM10020093_115060 [Planobispora longispora]
MMDGVLGVPEEERAHVIIEPDRAAAIDLAIARAGFGDVVVVAARATSKVSMSAIRFSRSTTGRWWPTRSSDGGTGPGAEARMESREATS